MTTYVRFHKFNPAGFSFNYRNNSWEIGNSCYKAEIDNAGIYCLYNTVNCNTLIGCVENHIRSEAGSVFEPIYEVLGEEVGIGSDGEPLLINVEIVRELIIKNGDIVRKP